MCAGEYSGVALVGVCLAHETMLQIYFQYQQATLHENVHVKHLRHGDSIRSLYLLWRYRVKGDSPRTHHVPSDKNKYILSASDGVHNR